VGSQDTESTLVIVWQVVGLVGAVIFCGRFYLQWFVSEVRKESVVPIGFWYMSTVGSLMLFPYGVFYKHSPLAALSQCFNLVVYARNLVHMWRGRGILTRGASVALHLVVGLVVIGAVALAAQTWMTTYVTLQTNSAAEARETWVWLGVGVLGQVFFGCRFALQWLVTEARRESVLPMAFWYVSLVAALLMMTSFAKRPEPEWLFVLQIGAPLPVYIRNLWLIHHHRAVATG
jgi:lipid-A-disaccharide synthase-like uncharacterized protein